MQEERNYKVYMHTNKFNNKKYIGITGKDNVKDRWQNGNGYKRCVCFYNAIKKYGWDNFEHEVIFCNLTKQLAEMFEVELIKYYNTTNIKYGYNLANGGKCGNKGLKRSDEFRLLMSKYAKNRRGEKSNHFNKKHSEETKLKIKLTSLGRKHSLEDRIKMSNNSTTKRSIICIETGEIFNSIVDASRKLNLYANHISAVCLGKRKTTGGLHFKYYEV